MKALGATSAVLTAKHGCGFLLFPPKTTLPSGAPYTYHVREDQNVLAMFAAEMTSAGIGYGLCVAAHTLTAQLAALTCAYQPRQLLLFDQQLLPQHIRAHHEAAEHALPRTGECHASRVRGHKHLHDERTVVGLWSAD